LTLYGTLNKIVDGDTLYFKTNNKNVKCCVSNKDMKSAGISAICYAKSLLTLNKMYEYDVSGKDRYGRSICVVHNGNSTFNEQMVISGYSTIYRYYMNKEELVHYEALLQKAKNGRVGMWSNRYEVMECLDKARR